MSNKLRNRLLALFCVVVFIGIGALFYTNWVVQRPFGVILFVADGFTPSLLTPARLYQGGADQRLNVELLPNLAVVSSYANDFAVPDAASASSAIATGRKVNNQTLSMDPGARPLETLLEIAQKRGRSVGLVSDLALTSPGTAAFYARSQNAKDTDLVAAQALDSASFDVVLGGGAGDFLPESKEGRRKDGRDLMLEFRRKGYDVVRSKAELEGIPGWRSPRVFGSFSAGNMAFADELPQLGSQPSLSEMVRNAIRLLQYNRKGYLLVVHAGLVGEACSSNQGERAIRELLELDKAVGTALAYSGEKALIIVCGSQSIGGMRMNGYPFKNDRGVAVIGLNPQGAPFITWSGGPGSAAPNVVEPPNIGAPLASPVEPAAVHAQSAPGVAEDVLAVSTGPGAEKLRGFRDNTEVFKVIAENL